MITTNVKPCNQEENVELLRSIAEGDSFSIERFIEGNMPYVVHKVACYLKVYPQYEFLRDDLISEGYLILAQIAERVSALGLEVTILQEYLFVALRNAFVHLAKKEIPYTFLEDKYTYEDTVSDVKHDILACCHSDLDKTIVRLRYEKYSDTKIAGRCSVSQSKITRARNVIRKRMEK